MKLSVFGDATHATCNLRARNLSRMCRNFLCGFLLALGSLSTCGCGVAAKPSSQPVARQATETDQVPQESALVNNANPTINPGHGSSELTSEGVQAEIADQPFASELIGPSTVAQADEPRTSTSANSVDAKPDSLKQAAQPSAEQLAQWVKADFETLQLLACRESPDTGLVTHLSHLLDGRHFITAGSQVTLWSVTAEAPEHTFIKLSGEPTIKSLAVAPDGT